MSSRVIFDAPSLAITLARLVAQIEERHLGWGNLCLIGLQPRGVLLARRLRARILQANPSLALAYGELDTTFHRDDVRRAGGALVPNTTRMDFLVEGKDVILVDDVLYTGRTVRAAMDALLAFGRPRRVELLVLIDRIRRRELPIEADYRGRVVETLQQEKVYVRWQESHGEDAVVIEASQPGQPASQSAL
jgi:pyrimidine operon attenuation protein / uracil phosphoribosyltransferase